MLIHLKIQLSEWLGGVDQFFIVVFYNLHQIDNHKLFSKIKTNLAVGEVCVLRNVLEVLELKSLAGLAVTHAQSEKILQIL